MTAPAPFKSSLLKEEYRAELLIAHVRIIIFFLGLIDALLDHYFFSGLSGNKEHVEYRIFGLLICIGISSAILLEVKSFGTERLKKYYGAYVKYLYITVDVLMVTIFLHLGLTETRLDGIIDIPVKSILAIAFTVPTTLFLILGILRFSPRGSVYTLVLCLLAYVVVVEIRGYYPNIADYFFREDRVNFAPVFFFNTTILMGVIATFIAYRLRRLIQRSKRQENLERFLPEQLARDIVDGRQGFELKGKRSRVTVLFADIRGFTSLAEKEEPEAVIDLLNTYLNDMIEIIFRYQGSIDKIMGDGIMAIFGAPLDSTEAPRHAVQSALDMLRKLEDFNQIRKIQGHRPLQIGIGIHTGDVILGNIGTRRRMDYTAIGDTVNTASRLESLTKKLDYPILLSGPTRESLNGDFKLKDMGKVRIRGKAEKLNLYGIEAASS
ncbi:MAG: adenylate/guanylate cyclase domain-containing protein [Leptospiraceae bacterium]|nr:adenylate/guanylate cyclase domain-containing protein [Leptospiraceae bacterium]